MLLKKIVVAEDDDAIAHMVNMALGDAGFLCMRAHDGDEALRLVRIHTPDLLVLDVMMPRLDGNEVARKLKADVILSKIPILMLTALDDVDSKVAGFEAGADDYLPKPFDLREFGARVKALIRQSRRERDRNPVTDLPGSAAVDDRIAEVLAGDADSEVLHLDVSGFDRYADKVGYTTAQGLVVALGRAILTASRNAGSEFVAHLGGVDFVAVTAAGAGEALARAVIDVFDDRRQDWTGDDGAALALAVGLSSTAGANDGAELARRLAAALRRAKEDEGSSYVVWQPEIA